MKSEKFKELVEKYLDGKINNEEEQLLFLYYDKIQGNVQAWDEELLGSQEDARLRLLNNIISDVKQHQPAKPKRKWIAVAALWFSILSVGGLLYFYQPVVQADKTAIQEDIPAGKYRAVLTLADGSKILLDDQSHGTLTRQGDVLVRGTVPGQLIYDSQGRADDLATVKYNTIATPRGGQYQVILPDGTGVWLNAESSITFPTRFNRKERTVSTTGEVYFEVAKLALSKNEEAAAIKDNPAVQKVPFFIKTKRQTVSVLGTHFNINAYDNEDAIKTSLLEGSVQVTDQTGKSESVFLRPGEQSLLYPGRSGIVLHEFNADNVVAWKDGMFIFDRSEIRTVMKQLERWYDVKVNYQGEVPNVEYTGSLPRNRSLNKVLRMLEQTGGARFKIKESEIIVLK